MSIGVITHLKAASVAETVALAQAAEAAGADWIGVPDAFWWRDTWVLLAEVARATTRIAIGPMVTNPYLRHPFHTIAALATLQELAGPRVFLGIGAGGSEVTGAAGIPRHDAPTRVAGLVRLLRRVAAGAPLDEASGRTLEVPLAPVRVLVAGRTDGILAAAGEVADSALLWAIPDSELERTVDRIARGAAAAGRLDEREPSLVWAPLVVHDEASRERIRLIAAYSVLNSRPAVRASWGLSPELVERIRRALVAGGAANAADLVPAHVIDDLVCTPDVVSLGRRAAWLGVSELALPAFDVVSVPARVAWARQVLTATVAAGRVTGDPIAARATTAPTGGS